MTQTPYGSGVEDVSQQPVELDTLTVEGDADRPINFSILIEKLPEVAG